MSLKDDKQQNIQSELDFSSALTGEARDAGREGTESSGAMNGTENPASTNRLMEEVCERENLKAALRPSVAELPRRSRWSRWMQAAKPAPWRSLICKFQANPRPVSNLVREL